MKIQDNSIDIFQSGNDYKVLSTPWGVQWTTVNYQQINKIYNSGVPPLGWLVCQIN